jgi:uncharacterized protein
VSHPNEDMLRRAYTDFARGDLDGYLRYCTDDISFHVPGRSQVSGLFSRTQFVTPFIESVIELTDGTFRETVLDIVAHDRRGVVLVEHEFERRNRHYKYRSAHVYEIRDGQLAEFREYPEDLYAFDEAWS